MSAYTTKTITRKEAEKMIMACRQKINNSPAYMSIEELDKELHGYVYSENFTDEVGSLYNYNIIE